MERLLALGTVVKAAVGGKQTARLMIIGYYPRNNQDGQVYDYATVLYPIGMSYEPAIQCINHKLILAVEKEGYLDEEGAAFTEGLPELIQKTNAVILDVLKEEALKADAAKAEAAKAAAAGENGTEIPVEKEAPSSDFFI